MSFKAQSFDFLSGLNRESKRKFSKLFKSRNKAWTPGRSVRHLKPGCNAVLTAFQTKG